MQIVYHLGAHGSDQGKLIRTLLRNREDLWKRGIEIPSPKRFRTMFGDMINTLNIAEAPPELQEILLDVVVDNEDAQRVILSQGQFLGIPQRAVSPEGLYPTAPRRLKGLSNLFPQNVVEFHLAVVHPATQVAALVAQSKGDYAAVMDGVDPLKLRWAPSVRAMLEAAPDREFVVWAQEDLPFTWPEVLRRVAGVAPDTSMLGDDAVLVDLLTPEVMHDLQAAIGAAPDLDIRTRRHMVETALAAGTTAAAMETDIALPGWSQDLIDRMSDIYADDLAELAAISGVEFISA